MCIWGGRSGGKGLMAAFLLFSLHRTMKDAMTLHHQRLARLAMKRRQRRARNPAVVLAKSLKVGRLERNIRKLMNPDETPAMREAHFRNKDLRKALPNVLRMHDYLRGVSPREGERIDKAMTRVGWQIDRYGCAEMRYYWPVAWGGADPDVVVI